MDGCLDSSIVIAGQGTYIAAYLIVLKLNLLMLNYFLNFKVISKTLWESLIQRKLKKEMLQKYRVLDME